MCLAVPSKIVTIDNLVATIDVFGARREVSLMLLPEAARVGDHVLVHAGYAIQKIDKESVESGIVMHEASIALSILDIVIRKCQDEGCSSVDSITVRIGKAAGVMPESLHFAFDAAKENTAAGNAKLIIETAPVGGKCNGDSPVHRPEKTPRFQIQLDKWPLSPGTPREASGVPCLNTRRGLILLSPVCRDPAIGV